MLRTNFPQMHLSNPDAHVFIPDGTPLPHALERVTHLGVGAHADDLEFMALHGIAACHNSAAQWFGGVTCTNGAGSARAGRFANFTDEQTQTVRREEQCEAARIGRYAVMIQLAHPSSLVRDPHDPRLADDLKSILAATHPEFIYTHNPADKHETHVSVFAALLRALRGLPAELRPRKLLGCEGWRGLDWMPDDAKLMHDVSGAERLAHELNTVFDSQIAGGKRYDLAVAGRRRANATFFQPREADRMEMAELAMDLTPLIEDDTLDPIAYVAGFIERFRADVTAKLARHISAP
jgi:LmbE family N-acetylglucosaminyl deacetylase